MTDMELGQLTNMEGLGWKVGQGLRTGANDFFYVDMLADGRFRSALLPEERLAIPRDVIRPAIRRQSDLRRLAGSSSRAGSAVLYLTGWALTEDADSGDWQQIDGDLADLIGVAARTIYQRGAVYRTVPELSAVRTNVGPGRFWYHLPPFTYRHEPDLFVARVNGEIPQPYLNGKFCGCVPRVVDANFFHDMGRSGGAKSAESICARFIALKYMDPCHSRESWYCDGWWCAEVGGNTPPATAVA